MKHSMKDNFEMLLLKFGSVQKDIEAFPEKAKQRSMTALTVISANLELSQKEFKYTPTIGQAAMS